MATISIPCPPRAGPAVTPSFTPPPICFFSFFPQQGFSPPPWQTPKSNPPHFGCYLCSSPPFTVLFFGLPLFFGVFFEVSFLTPVLGYVLFYSFFPMEIPAFSSPPTRFAPPFPFFWLWTCCFSGVLGISSDFHHQGRHFFCVCRGHVHPPPPWFSSRGFWGVHPLITVTFYLYHPSLYLFFLLMNTDPGKNLFFPQPQNPKNHKHISVEFFFKGCRGTTALCFFFQL